MVWLKIKELKKDFRKGFGGVMGTGQRELVSRTGHSLECAAAVSIPVLPQTKLLSQLFSSFPLWDQDPHSEVPSYKTSQPLELPLAAASPKFASE